MVRDKKKNTQPIAPIQLGAFELDQYVHLFVLNEKVKLKEKKLSLTRDKSTRITYYFNE